MPILCAQVREHEDSQIRLRACSALVDFVSGSRDLVSAVLQDARCGVLETFVMKSRRHGDINFQVRKQAALGLMQIAETQWYRPLVVGNNEVLVSISTY